MVRAPYFDNNGVKKGAWSQEEDDKLRAYILRYGHWNWRELPRFAGLSRCGKSCRLRWLNYLRPDVKHGGYTKEEEDLIIKLHEQLGNKWAKIAAELPGRTDNEIKNYWHTYLKKRTKKNEKKSEMKEQSSSEETSEIEININKNTEAGKAETAVEANATFHPILESSTLSPQETSSIELSCLSSDALPAAAEALAPATKWTAESCLAACEEDFWTTPFVHGDSYDHDGFPSMFFQEDGCFTSSYGWYYDQIMGFPY